jgi:hypothetical protein
MLFLIGKNYKDKDRIVEGQRYDHYPTFSGK